MDAQGLRIPRSLSPSLPAPRTALLHVPVPARLAAAPGAPSPRPFLPRSLRSLCPSLLPYNVPAQPLDRPARAARVPRVGAGGISGQVPRFPPNATRRSGGSGEGGRRAGGQRGLSAGPGGAGGREERGSGGWEAGGPGRMCMCACPARGCGGCGGHSPWRRRAARRCPGYRRLGAALQARPRARPIRHRLPRPGAPAPPVRAGTGGRGGRGSAGRGHSEAEGWVGGGGERCLSGGRGCAGLFHHTPSCHGRWWPFAFVGIHPVGKIPFTVGALWEQTGSLNLLGSTWVWSMAQHSYLQAELL